LTAYGFEKGGNMFRYSREIRDGEFTLTLEIGKDGAIGTELIEKETGEEYVLYKHVSLLFKSVSRQFFGNRLLSFRELFKHDSYLRRYRLKSPQKQCGRDTQKTQRREVT